ncbi:MAG: ACT domain-containing protein [Clostridiales bacterium]|jgi:hypothetical protein|nr:ACT domain-containing protein [Clostridiales bacterium]
MIKQLSVFIENKQGRLADVTGTLAEANINIHALSIADTTDFGILRLIVSNPENAKDVLRNAGFTVKTTEVAAVALLNKPGSLSAVLRELDKAAISIEYMYAFTSRTEDYDAIVVFSLADKEAAFEKIKKCDIKYVGAEVIARLDG